MLIDYNESLIIKRIYRVSRFLNPIKFIWGQNPTVKDKDFRLFPESMTIELSTVSSRRKNSLVSFEVNAEREKSKKNETFQTWNS